MCRLSLFFRVQKSGTEENLTIESQKVIEGGESEKEVRNFRQRKSIDS